MEKKAQGLSINAVILIILGLAVLVVLALGFMLGWNRLIPWLGEKNNVDTIAKACETACSSENLFNYCSSPRELSNGSSTFKEVTCYTLAYGDGFSQYGIKKCSALNCKDSVSCDTWQYTSPGETAKTKVVVTESGQIVTSNYCKTA